MYLYKNIALTLFSHHIYKQSNSTISECLHVSSNVIIHSFLSLGDFVLGGKCVRCC